MADESPANHITQKCRTLLVIGVGTLVGLVRLGCGLSAIVVMVILAIYDIPINITADQYILIPWIIIRVTIEVISCFLIFEDSLITKTLFGDRYLETKLLPAHLWFSRDFVRFCLRLTIAASFSCRAYENAATSTWTSVIADGYSVTSLMILVTGLILLVLSSIPVCRRLCWIHYSIGVVKTKGGLSYLAEYSHSSRVKRQIRLLSTVINGLHISQAIPAIIFHIGAFTSLLLGYSVACTPWRSMVNHLVQAVVAILLIIYASFRLKYRKFTIRPYLFVEAAQVHILATVVSSAPSYIDIVAVNIVVQCLGYILLVSPVACFLYIHVISFDTGSVNFSKWIRNHVWKNVVCFQNISRFIHGVATVAAIFALIFALLAVPLPWFRLDFSVDAEFGNVQDAKNTLQFKLSNATEELETMVTYGTIFESVTCEVYIAATASGPFVGLIPGGSFASKITREIVRKFKYFRELSEKGQRFLAQFVHMVETLQNLDAIFIDAEKSTTVGLSATSWGLVLFLLPPIITGITTVFVAFWPRDVRSCDTGDNKRFRIAAILVSAATNIVTFVFGLVLIYTGGLLVHAIADEMPYVDARVIPERGGKLILYSYILSLTSWTLVSLQGIMSLIKDEHIKIKLKWGKKTTKPASDAENGLGVKKPKYYMSENSTAASPMLNKASPDSDSDYQSGTISGSNTSSSSFYGHIQRVLEPPKRAIRRVRNAVKTKSESHSAPVSPWQSPLCKKKFDSSSTIVTSRERSNSANRGFSSSSSGISSDFTIRSRSNLALIEESPAHDEVDSSSRSHGKRSSKHGISKINKKEKSFMRAAKNTTILKDSLKNKSGNVSFQGGSHSLPPMPTRPPPRSSTQSGSLRSSDMASGTTSYISDNKGQVVNLFNVDSSPMRRKRSIEKPSDPPEKGVKLKHNLNMSLDRPHSPSMNPPRHTSHRRHQSHDFVLGHASYRPPFSPVKKTASKVSLAVSRLEHSNEGLHEIHGNIRNHHRSSEDMIGRSRARSFDVLRRDSEGEGRTQRDRFLHHVERRDEFLRQTSEFLQSGVDKLGSLLSQGGSKLHRSFDDLLDHSGDSLGSVYRQGSRVERSTSIDCTHGRSKFYVDLPLNERSKTTQNPRHSSTGHHVVLRNTKRDRSPNVRNSNSHKSRNRRSKGYTSKMGAKYNKSLLTKTTRDQRHSKSMENSRIHVEDNNSKTSPKCRGCKNPKKKKVPTATLR